MTTISFSSLDKCLSLEIKGHADYAEYGKDIVCSAASILAYTLADFLLKATKKGEISEPNIEMKDGYISIQYEARSETDYAFVKDKFDIVQCGYSMLQKTYPQHITIKKM